MAYNLASVKAILRQFGIGYPAGNAEGGSVQSQHEAACQFVELSLSLTGDDRLMSDARAYAEAKLAEHRAALGRAANPPASKLPKHGQAV